MVIGPPPKFYGTRDIVPHRLQKLPHIVQGFFRDQSLRYITA
jgi:hypothetical protein